MNLSALTRDQQFALVSYVNDCIGDWKRPTLTAARLLTGVDVTRAEFDEVLKVTLRHRIAKTYRFGASLHPMLPKGKK